VTDDNKAITTQLITWAAGQPFNNVLLLAIFASMIYGAYFAMNTAIPAHLNQIQKGYESLTESHRDERERTQQLYDRWMNRTGDAGQHNGSKVAGEPLVK
jgi:hypothetical protein